MTGDYPSTDFEIAEEGGIRTVVHVPTGVQLGTGRMQSSPIAVSAAYTLVHDRDVARPGEIVQGALRHLRVWLMRHHGARHARAPT